MSKNPTQPLRVPTFHQLKKRFLDSGYEVRLIAPRELERLALDAPLEAKRHMSGDVLGLIMPDAYVIGLARNQNADERAETLVHELIHLYDEGMEEETVEALTEEVVASLSDNDYRFLQLLVA